jgi:hypothetical protein
MALIPTRSMSIDKVRNHLMISGVDLKDARSTTISVARRFDAAYDAAFRCSLALLEANQLESKGEGHHRETLEHMVTTLGLEKSGVAERVGPFSRARNQIRYDAMIVVNETMLTQAISWAERIQTETINWFENKMPQALKPAG